MTTATPAGSPQAHTLRLLLPFFFQHGSAADAVARLCGLRHEGRKTRPCWTDAVPVPNEYRDETLPNVRDFLFDGGIAAGGCAYLRVPDETANAWFKNGGTFAPGPEAGARVALDGVPSDGERPGGFAVRLAAPGIELFLSPPPGRGPVRDPGAARRRRSRRALGPELSFVPGPSLHRLVVPIAQGRTGLAPATARRGPAGGAPGAPRRGLPVDRLGRVPARAT